jgi:hypothetical protein
MDFYKCLMLTMPKSGRVIELDGESQSRNMAKCINDDDIRSFTNNRTYKIWRRIHDKRCSCLLQKSEIYIDKCSVQEVKSGGFNGDISRKQKEFVSKME